MGFGVQRDGDGLVGIGGAIDVDAADALVMFDDGTARAFGDGTNQAFATTGDAEIYEFGECQQFGNGSAVGSGNDLDRLLRKVFARRLARLNHQSSNDLV